jgi:hypothetical protein
MENPRKLGDLFIKVQNKCTGIYLMAPGCEDFVNNNHMDLSYELSLKLYG